MNAIIANLTAVVAIVSFLVEEKMSGLFGRKEGTCACALLQSLTCSCSSNNTINTRGSVSSFQH